MCSQVSNGAADFIGLNGADGPPAPYANGDGPHAPPPPGADSGEPAAAQPAAARDPLEDLLALSGAQPAQQPAPGLNGSTKC